jgi:hydroxymethylpyrimidine pyrophosphatase-like HAD family hydrolase
VVIDISPNWLVVADVDGTLLGDVDGWSGLEAVLRENPHIYMVPNSSRPLVSLNSSWEQLNVGFPFPAQVGALGTEVTIAGQDVGWSDRFAGFDRATVDRTMGSMGYKTNGDEFQTPLKASFEVPRPDWEWVTAALQRQMQVGIVTSGASDFDVIPTEAGKAAPISYLADHFEIARDHIVAAGDSMNDLTMLAAAAQGIVVANAEPALIRAATGSAFLSTHLYARGVAEGLDALGLLA